ncbi:unnamed protein product [Rotaria sp. Silwood1]|nr:unnamed protein product [Rotaria sp. Silwood1]CAF3606987.1 unnamed protein product [Rotaria sp. Silwood1]
MNQQDCINEIKNLQDFQMDIQGWADIGYNFLICNYNDDQQQIYRGRGWIYRGAHCRDYNYDSLGNNEFHFLLSRTMPSRLLPFSFDLIFVFLKIIRNLDKNC